MLRKNFIPQKPFAAFKWKWASLQCTESLNDPVVLLGVLFRMRKLEPYGYKYNSPEFAAELRELSNDIQDSINVDLSGRVGERNIVRNSGQYWRAVGLLESSEKSGKIHLTDFGRRVADHDISQTEFAAITIQTLALPNPKIQSPEECQQWMEHDLIIYPLRLILTIVRELYAQGQGHVTPAELIRIIIPLSGVNAAVQDYIKFILWFRNGEVDLAGWPDFTPRDNDDRIAREFLIFLSNYGYLIRQEGSTRWGEEYKYNSDLDAEIEAILVEPSRGESLQDSLQHIRATDVTSEIERKRVEKQRLTRPNQARFRKDVLRVCQRCVITNVTMPEVLEAAHIKPFKYNGEDTIANGFAMRMDIHLLFDVGHLRISDRGEVHLSTRARMDYGAAVPPRITLPECINLEFIRWRWNNYNGL